MRANPRYGVLFIIMLIGEPVNIQHVQVGSTIEQGFQGVRGDTSQGVNGALQRLSGNQNAFVAYRKCISSNVK